jgi:hypothetical protein
VNARFAKGIATSLLALAAVGAANATIYVGRWDPQYGSPFTTTLPDTYGFNLGWNGGFALDASGCNPAGPGIVSVAVGGGCTATLTSSFVNLYDMASPIPPLETLNWGGVTPNATGTVTALLFDNGALVGLASSGAAFVQSSIADPFVGGSASPLFALNFGFATNADGITSNSPALDWVEGGCVGEVCPAGTNDSRDFPVQNYRITVPEPGTIALVALALGGVAVARRSRRAKHADAA